MGNQSSKHYKSNKQDGAANGTQRKTRQQPRKDSRSKRVNFDNTRADKFEQDLKKMRPGKRYPDAKKVTSVDNDVSWYARNAELLNAAASIPFASVLGNPVLGIGSGTNTVPGLMTFCYSPAFGADGTEQPFALNQAARSLYSFEVHANSRNYNYTDQDLMILILAGTQPFAMLASMIRAYGIVKTYSEQSKYTPDALLSAMGFYPADFRENLANIWFDINEMIARTGQIWIPNTMPLLQRWYWMNTNIYKDADSTLAQNYMYVQWQYFAYSETSSTTGGCLRPLVIDTSTSGTLPSWNAFTPGIKQYTWKQWKTAFDGLMEPLLTSEDRGIIFGDIMNAFGQDKIYAMTSITSDYRIEPVYSQEVLTQMENLIVTPFRPRGLVQNSSGGLTPIWDDSPVNTDVGVTKQVVATNTAINFHHNSPVSPAEIVVATRLQTVGMAATEAKVGVASTITTSKPDSEFTLTNTTHFPLACASETVNKVYVTRSPGASIGTEFNPWMAFDNTGGPTAMLAGGYMTFDWSPAIYAAQFTNASGPQLSTDVRAVYMEFDNYTNLTTANLSKLHNMAMFSLYGMPMF